MISHNFNLHGGNLPILSQLPILHSSLQSSCKLRILHSSNHLANFQSSTFGYENFSKLPILHFWLWKLLTKTSQNFQSSTFRYENFQFLQFSLRKLPIPPLLVTKTPLANFWFLDFGYKNLKLPIPPLLVTKTWNFQSSRKLPIPPTWKLEKPYPLPTTSNPPLLGLFFNEILIFSNFPPKCVFWTKLGGFPQICPHFFFFLTKWTFLQKFNPQKVPKMFIILLFLVLLLLQTFPTSTSYFLNNFYFLSLPNSQICLLFAVTSWTSTITRIFSLFLSLCKPKFFSKWKKTTKSGGFCSKIDFFGGFGRKFAKGLVGSLKLG